jgi:hypothetical protein
MPGGPFQPRRGRADGISVKAGMRLAGLAAAARVRDLRGEDVTGKGHAFA